MKGAILGYLYRQSNTRTSGLLNVSGREAKGKEGKRCLRIGSSLGKAERHAGTSTTKEF